MIPDYIMDTKYLLHSGTNSTCYYQLVFPVSCSLFLLMIFLNHVTDFLIVFSYQSIVNLQCSLVLSVQQEDLFIYKYICIYIHFQIFSIICYYKILRIVSSVIQQVLVVYLSYVQQCVFRGFPRWLSGAKNSPTTAEHMKMQGRSWRRKYHCSIHVWIHEQRSSSQSMGLHSSRTQLITQHTVYT